jgi:hypothetical protein
VPPSEPQPPSPYAAASCRGPGMPVPRARHGHAARVHTCALRPSPAQPCRAAIRPATPQPRHAPATASPCAATPRRGRNITFASRPTLWGFSPSSLRAPVRTHPRLPHTHTHTVAYRTGSGSRTRSGVRSTHGPACRGKRKALPPRPALSGREGEKRVDLGPACSAEPAHYA